MTDLGAMDGARSRSRSPVHGSRSRSRSPVHGSHESSTDLVRRVARQKEHDRRQQPAGRLPVASLLELLQPGASALEPLGQHLEQQGRRPAMLPKVARALIARRKKEGGLKNVRMEDGQRIDFDVGKEFDIICGMGRRFKKAEEAGKLNTEKEDPLLVDTLLKTSILDTTDFREELRQQLHLVEPDVVDSDDD